MRQDSEAQGGLEAPIRERKAHEVPRHEPAAGVTAPGQNPLVAGFRTSVDHDIHAGLQQRRSELRMPTTDVEDTRAGIQAERVESKGRLPLEEPGSDRP